MKSYFFTIILISIISLNQLIGQFPAGFSQSDYSNWNQPMAVAFDHQGRMFVGERAGKVYKFENLQKTLLFDLSEEVATYGDYGLSGLTLDPDFSSNGKIYVYYVVDRHHLINFGTANYSQNQSEQGATIARVTSYTLNSNTGYSTVLPNSRNILVGQNKNNGIPITGIWHAGGDLGFSVDGTLLVSTGDGAAGADYEDQALANGIITPAEFTNRRRWRCQMQNSLNGKILRIDPNTGDGLASNPFFDINNPGAAASKVWAMGFRNPFRFTIKPNSGNHNSAIGQPGTLVVADVGASDKEELNIITQGGQNCGWPKYEGFDYVFESNPIFEPVIQKNPLWNGIIIRPMHVY